MAASVVRTKQAWTGILHGVLGVNIVVLGYAFMQKSGQLPISFAGDRLDATLGNAGFFAAYLMFVIFITLFFVIRNRGWLKAPYAVLLLLQVIILMYTQTRGSILAVIFGMMLSGVLITFAGNQYKKWRSWVVAIVLIGIAGMSFLVMNRNTDFVQSNQSLRRFAEMHESNTAQSRFLLWNISLQGVKERPILGWGQEHIDVVFNKYYDPQMHRYEAWYDRSHNLFFDWALTTGILGLLTFLALIGAIFRLLWKTSNFSVAEKSVLTSLLVAYAINNFFIFDSVSGHIMLFTVLAWIVGISQEDQKPIFENIGTTKNGYIIGAVAVISVGLAGWALYAVNIKSIEASNTLIHAIRVLYPQTREPVQADGPAANLALFRESREKHRIGEVEAVRNMISSANSIIATPEQYMTIDEKMDYFNGIMETTMDYIVEREVHDTGFDVRPYFHLGTLQVHTGNFENGRVLLERAFEIAPNRPDVRIELARGYAGLGEVEKAVTLLEETYNAAPDNPDPWFAYVILAQQVGKSDIAQQLIEEAQDAGRYQHIIKLTEHALRHNPESVQNHISLSVAYLDAGRTENALKVLRAADKIFVEHQEEIQGYIAAIKEGKDPREVKEEALLEE